MGLLEHPEHHPEYAPCGLLCFLKSSKPCLGGSNSCIVLLKCTEVQRAKVKAVHDSTGPENSSKGD